METNFSKDDSMENVLKNAFRDEKLEQQYFDCVGAMYHYAHVEPNQILWDLYRTKMWQVMNLLGW